MPKQEVRKEDRTHCKRGHELSGENVKLMNKGGSRIYKKCLSCNVETKKPAKTPNKSRYEKPNENRMEMALSRGVFGEAMTRADIMRSRR
jgi:hypothetical protein